MIIVYAPRAMRDLVDIERYLETRSASGKRNAISAIKSSIDQLVRSSYRGTD